MFGADNEHGLDTTANPIIIQNLENICAVCLGVHDHRQTSNMQDMLPVPAPIIIYKLLESISLFKYNEKTPQLLCLTCSFKLVNIYEFQQMCNTSYFYFNNCIQLKDVQDSCKLENGDAGDVETNTENELFIEEVMYNNFPQEKVENKQKQDLIGAIFEKPTLDGEVPISTTILPLTNTEMINDIFRIEDPEDNTCKLEIEDTEIHGLESDSEGSIKSIQKRIDHQVATTVEKESCIDVGKSTITKFVCKYCNKVLCHKHALISHENLHTGEKPYRCNQCTKAYASPSVLHYHKLRHKTERPFCCKVCTKAFKEKRALTLHMQIHTNPLSHVCRICSKAFNRRTSLLNHMSNDKHINEVDNYASDISEQKPYKCKQCEKSFSNARLLWKHRAVHSEERRYACKLCDNKYKNSSNLSHHMMKHSGLRPFVCSICNKDFDRKGTLHIHMRTHQRVEVSL